ncbi:disease resistance protein At4g27190 [Spinacia oleracea]|uniref:Disease resistance protein At4g27190 n=1 Tax=Spinacia oleracea TaxID=3562 RepID=A0ABM3RI51_SPIOL|nr:disease resistance protein At4g27190-like [Spinacia oleracea]XP_056695293.1 disease resistance protein At4g27190-like [Spinacia oleracea]XP_056695294.1 disease resistance protein At4g27190-like [Spinacia oleracea]XP_056695295.1 disease resistance protein At4g27190-like [Spinacia oleracea]XP_056695296.1 disease resistance protein At4g27190-like [Spinacia oleracea]
MSAGIAILTGGAGQAAGSLVGPATDAGKGIYKSLKRKYNYIRNLGRNFEKLKKEVRYLSSRVQDVNDKIARNQVMMEKTHECATWLDDVKQLTENMKDLTARYQKANMTGSCGPCQLRTRLNLSREIVKVTPSVVELKDRMNLERILLRERPPERVEKKFPKKIDVPTLGQNVEKLLELLKNDSIKKIGVWGMPGVGKTTILETLHDEVEKHQIFDIVIWVTVLKEVNPDQIQCEILKQLGVKIQGSDAENQPATLISRSLEKKKYLLLLDEVSSEINLRDIGIHDSHVLGKVVIATRERTICDSMDMDEEIKVDRLSRDDARKLFRDAIGEAVEHPGIRPIAEKVLRQCGELPQVIKAVGIHLKGKLNEDLWRNTLSRLQSPSMYQLKHMEEVFTAFQLIYQELHSSLKDCLLYGASFPEDYEIYRDYLVECWKAEQLIGVGQTLRKACEEGNSNLENLTDRCLFDRCKSTKYVKMPIIFRNAAIRMAYQQNFGLLVIDGEQLYDTYPLVEEWSNAKVVSLMNSDLVELPENLKCSRISSLFLQKNKNLSDIPTSFFKSMPTLKILDLYGTGIKFLPSSVSELTNLSGLYLNDCQQLVHLPAEIGKLHNLEVLDIRRTGIRDFPMVIKELTCLRCLRVSFTSDSSIQNHVECNGDISPSRIFEQLLKLEELTIDADPKDSKWNKIAPEIAQQLANLRKLSSLSFYFPTTESLETFTQTSMSWKNGTPHIGRNFRSFNIYVGSYGTHHNSSQFDISKCSGRRYLQFCDGKDTPSVIKEVLGITCAFKLIGHQNIINFSDFGIDKMEGLEVCEVKECNIMTTFVGSIMDGTHAFPWLRELHLVKLQQLDHICQGPISSGSFARLITLTVYDCPNLLKVVSSHMVKQLTELQHLRVEKCSQVMEVVEFDTQSTVTATFPKLKVLELINLEELVNIHVGDSIEWNALQQVDIVECEKLTSLSINKMNATKLQRIKCSATWWRALMLNDEIREHLETFLLLH